MIVAVMHVFMLILDGAADVPLPQLAGRTPLEAADLPHLRLLASHGASGLVQTVYPGLPIDSLACTLGLLGYDPQRYYPGGRASCEALGQGLLPESHDVTLRCNLVTVRTWHQQDLLIDFTAGTPDTETAMTLLQRMHVPPDWTLYPGQSYRNLLIVHRKTPSPSPADLILAEPHMHVGDAISKIMPTGRTPEARQLAARFTAWMRGNRLPEGIMPWVWSASRPMRLPSFTARTGMTGTVIAGLDFMHGLAIACGLHTMRIDGFTGDVDTDYRAKGRAAIEACQHDDFVLVHVNAPDEASHRRDPKAKIMALENADRDILGPVMEHTRSQSKPFCIIVTADHTTRSTDGRHDPTPPPYFICSDHDLRQSPLRHRFTAAPTRPMPIIPATTLIPRALLRSHIDDLPQR